MKDTKDVTAVVIDYGTFIPVAEKLAETMKTVYYYSPFDTEYQDVRAAMKGTGLERVIRIDDPLMHLLDVDLYVFTDIGMTDLQLHLRDNEGKAVWGHFGGTELELYRDYFVGTLQHVSLATPKVERIVGLTNLSLYLSKKKDKWIKINRFRSNMETWHHEDYAHSERNLEKLAIIFGPLKEEILFTVWDAIDSDDECGYDGWCIDGKFPLWSFEGYEDKNEAYLGRLVEQRSLRPEIEEVNRKIAPILKSYGYRDFWATEIRVAKDGQAFFIDATPRMPGQSGEYLLENYSNFAEIVWAGANGELVAPKPRYEYGASATVHFVDKIKDPAVVEEWHTLHIPKSVERWFKFCHYCKRDGAYQFANGNDDEAGVVIGVGDTPKEAIEHLKSNFKALEGLPVTADIDGFPELLKKMAKKG